MTLHVRQPVQAVAEFDPLIAEALSPATAPVLYRDIFKRAFDVAAVLLSALPVLAILLPLLALIALDGGAPIYRQARVGRNGSVFRMWKLRTMVPDAEARLESHLAADPHARLEWTVTQKLRRDPRITPIGHLLRKTSLDELPQLWNVLAGDMALVGPRPMMVNQRALYPGSAYYALRPGITGFWQTSVRNEASFAERARFDAAYLRELSFGTDMRVLARTVRVVVTGTGC
ncbi:Sugar transferase involved in LPS biosynthesis (colanic, teichoic acid) [Roseivivax marinus]|uniref:sugar transferase n=1 Tax=Roseivivax marinus TaxID=1379903 RepID=UPI0008CB9CA7|nr:sugar transferase [Roseivivax marinus]SEK24862.1 Sugar transferase involved in LPS biosynthesis (colanic, teichoic acid) [Roseivivax marinus]